MELAPPLALWAGPRPLPRAVSPPFRGENEGVQGTLALPFPESLVPEGRAVWASQSS